MKRIYKAFAGAFSLFIAILFALTIYAEAETGAAPGGFWRFGQTAVETLERPEGPRRIVVPGGTPFGIKMHTHGVLVVGMSDIQTGSKTHNPAKDAGLKIGDIIVKIGGLTVNRNDDVARFVSQSNGDELIVTAIRDNIEMDFYLTPAKSDYDKGYKVGVWVRDSSAGIGTLTYYDPEDLTFGGLGHAVCDIDTGALMPLFSGEIVDVNISGVNAGLSGRPGELRGTFLSESSIGRLSLNSECGIFGFLHGAPYSAKPVEMAFNSEIAPGPATILVTISGNKPRSFEVLIERVNHGETSPNKNMVLRVTDSELLSLCGGIVQGMSGSPILQDGRLAGAVTHVFVNDPTRGYGIFAENMDKMLNFVKEGRNLS
jgi:stage IV sporulation protein B